jgi:hypothetical protein
MKKVFFVTLMTAISFFDCVKKSDQPTSVPAAIKTLVANAGLDTIICMPYGGTGDLFKAILNGKTSHDDGGKIISYLWTEVGNSVFSSDKDSTEIILAGGGGSYKFLLKLQDDHNQVDADTVVIRLIPNFAAEYDDLSWDSTVGGLTTISVKHIPGLIETWPGPNDSIQLGFVYISDFSGVCKDKSSWKQLPYVPYDSIQLTDKAIFYSVNFTIPNTVNFGTGYPEIYAKTNSGINFNQNVSVGFINGGSISNAGYWDY